MPIIEVPCVTNPSCEHGDLIEENKRLKATFDKGLATCIQGKKNLDDLLSTQRDNVSKEGIGFPPKNKNKKKKNKKKKVMATSPSKMITFVKEGEKPLEVNQHEVAGVSGMNTPEYPAKKA